MTEFKPYSKEQQLARGDRRYKRRVASPAKWQRIIDEKKGPCRVCGGFGIEFHHLVAKSLNGDDIAKNMVPLCRPCHGLVEARDKAACRALRLSLTDDEYAYCVTKLGEGRFENRYPVRYEKP